MINLLPDPNKKAIDREYRLRRLAWILFSCFLITLAAALFMLPSFMVSFYKIQNARTRIASATTKASTTDADLEPKIDYVNLLIRVLKPDPYNVPSEIISIILKDKGPSNSLTGIVYNQVSTSTLTVSLSGKAKTRQSLVDFTDALSHETSIKKVDIPVSNFAKDANIDFSFIITIKSR